MAEYYVSQFMGDDRGQASFIRQDINQSAAQYNRMSQRERL